MGPAITPPPPSKQLRRFAELHKRLQLFLTNRIENEFLLSFIRNWFEDKRHPIDYDNDTDSCKIHRDAERCGEDATMSHGTSTRKPWRPMAQTLSRHHPPLAKSLQFAHVTNAKIQRVQESLTAARKGKGLFGLKD